MSSVFQYSIPLAIVFFALTVVLMLPTKGAEHSLSDRIGRGVFCLVCGMIGLAIGALMELLLMMTPIGSIDGSSNDGAFWIALGLSFGILWGFVYQVLSYLSSRNK
ncbi:hypothetical protein Mal52_52760 [Symmachiella dynata]|uniref:Transmembrane protein n=1 Tax=Symmachiella dynata TaxID=2527995 RepID=A0A517ZWB5_9PLAN|nr:hypothetical protein [Symmachiella dynata]QDU46754.1 hypothetical protein Mal52_52760 [Symmachiella dynata]